MNVSQMGIDGRLLLGCHRRIWGTVKDDYAVPKEEHLQKLCVCILCMHM